MQFTRVNPGWTPKEKEFMPTETLSCIWTAVIMIEIF